MRVQKTTGAGAARFGSLRKLAAASVVALTLAGGLVACGGTQSPEKLLADAKSELEKKDLKAAEIQLKNLLQQQPDNGEARYLLGQVYLANFDFLSAEKELRRAYDLKYDANKVAPGLARAMMEIGQGAKIATDLAGAEVTEPAAKAVVETYKGRVLLGQGKRDEGRAAVEAALALDPNLSAALVTAASLRYADKDLEGAARLTDQVLEADPSNVEALLTKADLEFAQSRVDSGKAFLEKAIAVAPTLPGPRSGLINVLLNTQKYEEARKQIAELRKIPAGRPSAQFFLAQLEFSEKKFPAARDAVAQVLKTSPDYIPALIISGGTEFALGNLAQSEATMRKVVAKQPGNVFARRVLAATLLRQGRPQEADDVLQPMLKAGYKDPAVLALAGDIALQKKDVARAKDYFTKAAQIAPKDAVIRTALGVAEIRAGDPAGGIAELEKAVELDGSQYRADVTLIMTHLRAKQWDKALTAVAALEKKQPDNPLTYNLAAAAYLGKNDVKGARASLEKALAKQPTYMPAVLNLVQLDLREKKPDEAQKRLEAVLQKEPNNAQALTALAQFKARQGAKREEVGALLEKAQKGNPDALPPRITLARFYLESKENSKAVALAQETVSKFPGSAEALDLLGSAQLASGERTVAVQTYRKLVAENDKNPVAHTRLAAAQVAADDLDGARRSYRKALELNPKLTPALTGLITLEMRAGRTAEALKVAQNLQKADPKEPAGFTYEGDIHLADKKPALAVPAYRKSLALKKEPAVAIKLHSALNSSGKKAEADSFVTEWRKGNPNDTAFSSYLAERKMVAKDWEGAKADYRAIVDKQPTNALALNNLAWASLQTKDPKALEYAEKAAQLAPNNIAILDTLAMVLAQTGDTKRSVETFQKALKLAPNADGVRLHYAQTLANAGQKAEAKKELEAILGSGRKFAGEQAARDLLSKL